jgi:hypothetical protein
MSINVAELTAHLAKINFEEKTSFWGDLKKKD